MASYRDGPPERLARLVEALAIIHEVEAELRQLDAGQLYTLRRRGRLSDETLDELIAVARSHRLDRMDTDHDQRPMPAYEQTRRGAEPRTRFSRLFPTP